MERRCLAKSDCADDQFANRGIYSGRVRDVPTLRALASVHAVLRPFVFWKGANRERRLDGAQSRHERRPENNGHHYPRAFTGTKAGRFDHLPAWLEFLRTPVFAMPLWVKVLCAATMAVGTAAGGWRIIRTLGHRIVRLQPVHGFAAETSAALIIQAASIYGIPLSTTHVISTSIMGVGAVKRFSGMKWRVVERISWAWLFTLPASGLLGYALARTAAAL